MKDGDLLNVERCPYCGIARPNLPARGNLQTMDHAGDSHRLWSMYACSACGGVVMTMAHFGPVGTNMVAAGEIQAMWPSIDAVPDELPERAAAYLTQAINCLHAPVAAITTTASAIDAMLKGKGLKDGSLYQRIELAAQQHLITEEMKAWAHEVRLDANDQRHADEDAPLPGREDASKCIEFAKALAQFLYVLPARVKRGRGK